MAIPGESDYIYGFHDPGNWRWVLTEKGRTGWVLVTEEIGYDPNAHSAPDYREWSDAGFGVLVRLNNGYSPGGTIPHSRNYDNFARRCANHVGDSKGAHIWIIGNEMNHANEQPGVRFEGPGFTAEELITPDKYAACFRKVRAAIKSLPGHENDQVVLGAVAPYTAVIGYPGNDNKSWVKYFTDCLNLIGANIDGIALHTYTHGANPDLIFDEKQPWPQYPGVHYHFRAYKDFMSVIPPTLRRLPIYITETDQSDDGVGHILPWADTNSGWVRNAYKEINDWNSTPGNQQIRCLLLYRWGRFDDWYIEGKRGVIDDTQMAAEFGYKWSAAPAPTPTVMTVPAGKPSATANDNLNVRSGPGSSFSRVGMIKAGAAYEIVGRSADNAWLQIPYPDAKSRAWISAQFATVGGNLGSVAVVTAPTTTPAPPPTAPAPARTTATAVDTVNVRRGPGQNFGRVGTIKAGVTYEVVGRSADSAWLQIPYPDARSRAWISAQFANVTGNLGSIAIASAPTQPSAQPAAPTKTTARANDELNVRGGPGTQFKRIGGIKVGTTLEVVGRSADNAWLQVPYANGQGWISAQFVTVSGNLSSVAVASAPAQPTGPAQPAAPAKTTAKANDELNVRNGPGTQFKRIGGVKVGATLEVVGRSADNAWLQITSASGQGWVSAQFVTVSGSLASIPIAGTQPAPAPGETQVVGGFTLSGNFLAFYRANLQLTGAPISNVSVENGVQTQYFESLALQASGGGVRPAPIGRELINARRAIAEMQNRVAQAAGGAALTPDRFGFQLQDVSASLPSSTDKKWPRRQVSEIAYIVIHHTAAAGTLPPADLARAMIQQDKPGMKYHFYVAANGAVYQTQPLDALTDHAAGQSRTSVGVALAGNFVGDAVPGEAQLSSAGELCAWLLARLNLSESRIRGMSEIVPSHQSPGEQWIKGANWKERLLAVADAVLDSLRGRVPIALTVSVAQPKWEDKTKSLPTYNKLPAAQKKQGDSLEYPTRTLDAIRYLVIHHSGKDPNTPVEQIAAEHVNTQVKNNAGQITKEQWPGIGYHFYITADGKIVKCNDLTTVCYHVSDQNAAAVGICFAGNFTPANAMPPNGAQLAAGGQLIAWLMDQLNLELDAIKGDQELAATDCPGQWTTGFAWKHMLEGTIGAKLTLSA